jgi:muramoyltetrapeptide carboxypeptidase LdcA involved in peptidoglycan recycling
MGGEKLKMKKKFDKELDNILQDLKNAILENDEDIDKALREEQKTPTLIHIEKNKDGNSKVKIEGTNLSLLITLAGLEMTILEQLNPPAGLFDLIKRKVGIKGADK